MVRREVTVWEEGTEFVVLSGPYKGQYGVISASDETTERYFVRLPDVDPSRVFILTGGEISELSEEEDEKEDTTTPGFGMTSDEFAQHLEFLIERSLDKVPTVGAAQAFFGYQEFEGLSAEDVLLSLLDKLEEGIAHLAQAHILISRIGVSYRTIIKEITDAQND